MKRTFLALMILAAVCGLAQAATYSMPATTNTVTISTGVFVNGISIDNNTGGVVTVTLYDNAKVLASFTGATGVTTDFPLSYRNLSLTTDSYFKIVASTTSASARITVWYNKR